MASFTSLQAFDEYPNPNDVCEISPSHEILSCKGTFIANNLEELTDYTLSVGLQNGYARHLRINFNVERDRLNIGTPCRVILNEGMNLNITERNFCVNAHQGFRALGHNAITARDIFIYSRDENVIFREGANLQPRSNMLLLSNNRVIIQNNAVINVPGVFKIMSLGEGENSLAHIRHESQVSAFEFVIKAGSIASLGHSSNYQIGNNLVFMSPFSDTASIHRDTKIKAENLIMNTGVVTRIGARVEIDAFIADINASECQIPNTVTFITNQQIGNCFSGNHPKARLVTSDTRGAGSLTLEADVSRTTFGGGDFQRGRWRFFKGDPGIEATGPTNSHFYAFPGVYQMEFTVWNSLGLRDTARRRIDVDEVTSELSPEVSFRYGIDPLDPD